MADVDSRLVQDLRRGPVGPELRRQLLVGEGGLGKIGGDSPDEGARLLHDVPVRDYIDRPLPDDHRI
jgi:hypothetical protein